MAAEVTFTYNGSNQLVAVCTGLTPLADYDLLSFDPDSTVPTATSDGSGDLTITINDIGGLAAGDTFYAYVTADSDIIIAAVITLRYGTAGSADQAIPATWTYDGVVFGGSISAAFTGTVGVNYQAGQGFGFGSPVAGTGGSDTAAYTGGNFIRPTFAGILIDADTGMVLAARAFVSGVAGPGYSGLAPAPPPSSSVLIASPPWRIVIADIVFNGSSPPGFATLTFFDRIAVNRELNYYLRKAGTGTGRVSADNPEVNIVYSDGEPFLSEGLRVAIWLRREGGTPPWKARHCGIILQASRTVTADQPYVDFTSYEPRELLYKRPVRRGNGTLLGPNGLTFRQQRGSVILQALLTRTFVADGWHFIDTTTGTLEDTDPIDINFQQGSSVGEALDQLEATGTLDVLLPAVYDPVGSPGILAQLNIYQQAGSVKHGAIMSWDLPGRTLTGIDWLEDGTLRENNVELYTADNKPTPVQSDATSEARFGPYWGQQNYPVQAQLAAITAQAAVRLAVQKDHPETVQLSPSPQLGPVPFLEYFLADWLPTYGSARLGKALAASYRVYEMRLDLVDDSGETPQLLVSANLDPPA